MKTVLVFNAPDVLSYDHIRHALNEKGIETFGRDSSIHVIYPDTPNFYFGGASAVNEGYPLFVDETHAPAALEIIQNLEANVLKRTNVTESPSSVTTEMGRTYLNRFYLSVILAFFIPVLPLFLGLYCFFKAMAAKEIISTPSLLKAIIFLLLSCGYSFIYLKWIIS